MATVNWGENARRRDYRKLKRVLTIVGGVSLLAVVLGLLLGRLFDHPLPAALLQFKTEDVRAAFTSPAQDAHLYRTVNVYADASTLKEEIMQTGKWSAQALDGHQGGGWFLRSQDHSNPILNIQINVGRFSQGKSWYYYDHPQEVGWAEGWSGLEIVYRPSFVTRSERFLKDVLPEKLGRKKPAPLFTSLVDDRRIRWMAAHRAGKK